MPTPKAATALPFVVGAGLVLGSGVLASRPRVHAAEERLFLAVNGLGERPAVPLRAVMQLGALGAVPAVSLVAALGGRRGLAARLAIGGGASWIGAKAVKRLVARGRPATLHDSVQLRGSHEGDYGWISGHAAVSTALALIAASELPVPAAAPLVVLPLIVGFARIYVGAHEPLDVVGGVGFGMMVAALVARW